MEIVRRHIWFTGRVQGVGFRHSSRVIAKSLGLTGWVKNSWDGRVEMEVQGTSAQIEELISRLQEERFIVIRSYEAMGIPVEKEKGFRLRDFG